MVNLIIFLVAVILSIVLGSKTKTNVGIWGIVFAFILGFAICKLPATKVLANFPTTLFYNFFIACLFYGFAAVNGTMEVLARKLMYFFRNVQWMAPITLFLSALIISACGSIFLHLSFFLRWLSIWLLKWASTFRCSGWYLGRLYGCYDVP